MGYEEAPLILQQHESEKLLEVNDIPGMRAPMSLSTTSKFVAGTLSRAAFWPVRILGFISPAATGRAKAARAKSRWQILVKTTSRMVSLGLDFSSWSVGQARAAWGKGYDFVNMFTCQAEPIEHHVYKNATIVSGPPNFLQASHPYFDGFPQGIHLGQDSAL